MRSQLPLNSRVFVWNSPKDAYKCLFVVSWPMTPPPKKRAIYDVIAIAMVAFFILIFFTFFLRVKKWRKNLIRLSDTHALYIKTSNLPLIDCMFRSDPIHGLIVPNLINSLWKKFQAQPDWYMHEFEMEVRLNSFLECIYAGMSLQVFVDAFISVFWSIFLSS